MGSDRQLNNTVRGISVAAFALALVLKSSIALASDRLAVWSWSARAVSQIVDGELSQAVNTLRRARRIAAHPVLDALVGVAGLAGGQLRAGRRHLQRAVERGSVAPQTLYWLARALLLQGALTAAIKQLRHAITLRPDDGTFWIALAMSQSAVGQQQAAENALRRAAKHSPCLVCPQLFPTPAQGAVALLHTLSRRFFDRRESRRIRGHLRWRLGLPLAAWEDFSVLSAAKRPDADALQMIARIVHSFGDFSSAKRFAQRAVDANADFAPAREARGLAALALGEAAQAIADLEFAARLQPRNAAVLVRLAQAYAQAHKLRQASRMFRFALRRKPRLRPALLGLSRCQTGLGQHRAAYRTLGKLLRLGTPSPVYHESAAQLASLLGKHAAAKMHRAEQRRRIARNERRVNRLRRSQRAAALIVKTMQNCECANESRRCAGAAAPACREAVAALGQPARRFFSQHLWPERGHPTWGRRLLRQMKIRRLLRGDPLALAGADPAALLVPRLLAIPNTLLL